MLGLFYMGLNGFPPLHACVNVRFPDRLARVTTRTRNTPEDRMGTHICPHRRDNAGTCHSGQGGHNGRMWCIILAPGATG